MITFATYEELQSWSLRTEAKEFSAKTDTLFNKTVFLSHSSKDASLVAGAVLILENHGGRVYVDRADPANNTSDVMAIAANLRNAIRKTRKFVMLATPRSKDSCWIPWELGLGDGIHGDTEVALFPSAESPTDQQWAEREYLGLYRRIVYGNFAGRSDMIWMVINHRNFEAIPLQDWIKN